MSLNNICESAMIEYTTNHDISTFYYKFYFSSFHYFEVFVPNKKYTTLVFEMDYGKGIHNYKFVLYNINLVKGNVILKMEKYIVALELLTLDEIKELEPYCNCIWHQGNFISRLWIDKDEAGCLMSNIVNPSQCRIDWARECKESEEIKKMLL